jgi:hypothetical protein
VYADTVFGVHMRSVPIGVPLLIWQVSSIQGGNTLNYEKRARSKSTGEIQT